MPSPRPRKAYKVELVGHVIKHAIVWADTIEDAKRRYYDELDTENVEVVDNDFYEVGLRRPRRLKGEDRDA